MDLETVPADTFGRSLTGVGLNILTRDAAALASFMVEVFGLTAHRVSRDFAILRHGEALIQLHADATYGAHPLSGLLPEAGLRGAGMQVFLFGVDPDAAAARAEAAGGVVLEPPADKPHGLREATVLAPEGQAFSPAVARTPG
jgi:predicted enzyme related to lactoylglutathione lyase